MSNYNNHDSLYEDSDYPSRRQAPRSSGAGGGASKKRRRKKKGGLTVGRVIGMFFKVLGTLILIGLCTGALLCCFAAVYINEVIVPQAELNPDDFPMGENSVMLYKDKATGEYKELQTLFTVTKSVWVDFEEMPKYLIDATVAIEDKRFWEHPGVDWRRTAKAILAMFTGQDISGGSTITQQLIKNMTEYDETTVKRKILEIVRAVRFTQNPNNSKESTIERYLNIIPLGSGCEGVGAASLEYFGKPVSELTLAECASLISITNNPSKYGPYSFARSKGVNTEEIWDARDWNKYRQEVVLQCMLEQGKITKSEHDAAVAQELNFVRVQGEEASTDIYTWYEETVIDDVREALAEERGWSEQATNLALERGGLRIYTCFDPEIQAIADEIYTNRENLNYTYKNGEQMQSTIAVIDNQTHDLVAIVGQFGKKTVNRGSNFANGGGNRQPGSSFKPLAVYSPAIEFGKIIPNSVFDDYPYDARTGSAWPKNAGTTHYQGRITVREALKQSLNTVAVRIISDVVTPEESFKFVQERYHIDLEEGRTIWGSWKTDIAVAPMSMGGLTNGTNVRDMAEAYSTFPNGGYYAPSRTFTKITQLVDGQEVLLVDNTPQPQKVIKETTAYYMNDLLQGVFTGSGTASGKGIKGQHAAGKTGTTSDNKDSWFVGYTPYYTAAVWTGYAHNYDMPNTGWNSSLLLWRQVMAPLHENLPDKDYSIPAEMRSVSYCKDSGLKATEWCAKDPRGNRVARDYAFPEDIPSEICNVHTEASVVAVCKDAPILKDDGTESGQYYAAGEFCPEESRMEMCLPDYEREPVGSARADDEAWRYAHAAKRETCNVHTEEPPEDIDPENPEDPNHPVDPNLPINPIDPNFPYLPFDPNNPGGTTNPGIPGGTTDPSRPGGSNDPINPGGTTEPGQSGEGVDPSNPDALPPSQDLAG